MKNILKKSIIMSVLLLFIPQSSALLSDNFNDCNLVGWTIQGSWTTQNASHLGETSCYAKSTSTAIQTKYIRQAVNNGESSSYWSYDFLRTATNANTKLQIQFDKNATSTSYFEVAALSGTITSTIPGWVPFAINATQWYRMRLTMSGTNVVINTYNQNLDLTDSQTLPYTPLSFPTQFNFTATNTVIEAASYEIDLDNVVVSSVSPTTTTATHIEFDASEYFNHDLATITWGITDADWSDIFYTKTIYLDVVDSSGISERITLIDSPPQNGSYVYQINKVGIYTVSIQERFLGLGDPIVMADDGAIVRQEAQSYIYTDATTAFMRVPFNVHYNIGYSLTGYTSEIEIIGTNTVTGGIVEVSIIDASIGNVGTQIMQQTDVKVWPEGQYTLKLYDARKDLVLDTKFITIVNNPRLIPVLLFNTSSISTDRATYFINDYMTIDFKVDDANFTNYTIRADIYNFNTSTTTKQFFTAFTNQTSSFETLVNSKVNMQCDRGIYCWFEPGNNQIQLVRYNDTFSSVIASQNFTVSSTTVDGWGLSLSSQNVSTKETLTMKVIVPSGQTGKLQIRDPGFSPNATKIYLVDNIGEGTQTYKTTITRVGTNGFGYYEVEIIDKSNNIVKMHLPITVSRTPGAGETPTTPQSKATDFLSSDMWPALIIMLLFAGAGVIMGGVAGLLAGFGGGFIFLAVFDMIPVWALFLFAIVIIVVFSIMMSRGIVGGGQD